MIVETEHFIIVKQPKPFFLNDDGKLELLNWYEELYLQGYEFIELLTTGEAVLKKPSTLETYIKYCNAVTKGINNEKS